MNRSNSPASSGQSPWLISIGPCSASSPMRVPIVHVDDRIQLDGDALGRNHFRQPAHRQLAQLHHALGEREVLGQPVQQRDFFEGVEQVGRDLGHLLLELQRVLLRGQISRPAAGSFAARPADARGSAIGPSGTTWRGSTPNAAAAADTCDSLSDRVP